MIQKHVQGVREDKLSSHLPDDPARFHPQSHAGITGYLVERLALECLGHGGSLPEDQERLFRRILSRQTCVPTQA